MLWYQELCGEIQMIMRKLKRSVTEKGLLPVVFTSVTLSLLLKCYENKSIRNDEVMQYIIFTVETIIDMKTNGRKRQKQNF